MPETAVMHRLVRRATAVAAGILIGAGGGLLAPPAVTRAAHVELLVAASPGPTPAPVAVAPPSVPAEPPNVYAATMRGLAPQVADIPPRVYVPNEGANSVTIIDPRTYTVVGRLAVGSAPQHVTPSYDLRALFVNDTDLTQIDPRTSRVVRRVRVPMPYNLYYTPDGTKAIVVAEELHRLDFYDPAGWTKLGSVTVPWSGVDHMDFSADGDYLMASCEFSGRVVKIDMHAMKLAGSLEVGGLPVDVKLAPAGDVFFVANQGRGGVSVIDPEAMRETSFIVTGRGAHGLSFSRDTRSLYVTNRLAGTISVIDVATRVVRATWAVGGSPDMLQVSPDGTELWTGNRFGRTVIVVDTATGAVTHTITVESRPHGLTYFPQPGRVSLGHNGVYR